MAARRIGWPFVTVSSAKPGEPVGSAKPGEPTILRPAVFAPRVLRPAVPGRFDGVSVTAVPAFRTAVRAESARSLAFSRRTRSASTLRSYFDSAAFDVARALSARTAAFLRAFVSRSRSLVAVLGRA